MCSFDTESYAHGFNEGVECAHTMAHLVTLGDDGVDWNPDEWLAGRLARERYNVLRKVADMAKARSDLGGGPLDLAPEAWLSMMADTEAGTDAAPEAPEVVPDVDLKPIHDAVALMREKRRDYGGGTGEAFSACADLLARALAQVDPPKDDLL
jgi:hypothetical protein